MMNYYMMVMLIMRETKINYITKLGDSTWLIFAFLCSLIFTLKYYGLNAVMKLHEISENRCVSFHYV